MKTLATALLVLALAPSAFAKCSASCNGTEVVTNGCSHKQIEGLKDICGTTSVTTTTLPNLGGPAPTTTTTTLPSSASGGTVASPIDCLPTPVETRVTIDHCRHYNEDATKGLRCNGHLAGATFPCKGYFTFKKGARKGQRRAYGCALLAG